MTRRSHESVDESQQQAGDAAATEADQAAKDLALKAGAGSEQAKEREPLHYPPEVEARFKALEDKLESIIKQNCLRVEGER